jgi:hypothetical protein
MLSPWAILGPVRGNYTDFVRQKEMKMENWKKKYDLQEMGSRVGYG